MVVWRLTGQSRLAWHAGALIIIGLIVPLVSAARMLRELSGAEMDIAPLARTFLELAALPLALVAVAARRRTLEIRMLRIATPLLLVIWMVAAVSVLRRSADDGPAAADTWMFHAAAWSACGLWAALSAVSFWRSRNGGTAVARWGAVAPAFLSGGELLSATMPDASSTTQLAAGLQLAAAVLVAGTAIARLRLEFRSIDNENLRLSADLADARTALTNQHDAERDRLHDAQNVTFGLLGVARQLVGPSSAGPAERRRLADLMAAELDRLQSTLDPDATPSGSAFRLVDVVEPVVRAHHLAGAPVELIGDDTWAVGRTQATATAVANLLTNARLHAPNARITVRTVYDGRSSSIQIDDDGPGIPPRYRDLVLLRGQRGPTAAPGSGLGLPSAARAMRAQGGALDITDRPGGGTRVILRLPTVPTMPADPVLPALPA